MIFLPSEPIRGSVDFPIIHGSQDFLSEMTRTGYARKMDSSGRVLIPIRLREELGLTEGTLCEFLTDEKDGKKYLCIEVENEIEKAKKVLEANGYQISTN